MPLEYYLGGAVALIVLVLLGMALTGKKSARRVVVTKSGENEELTRQVARAADALEALLAHLRARPLQAAVPVPPTVERPPASPRAVEVPMQVQPAVVVKETPERPVAPVPVSPTNVASAALAPEAAIVEPAGSAEGEPATSAEQKPRRVKLSMFGR